MQITTISSWLARLSPTRFGVMSLLSAAVFIVVFLWRAQVLADDNAGIFFYGAPPSPTQIAGLADGANVTYANKGNLTKVIVKWPEVSIVITIDPSWNRKIQLSGIRGWLSLFPESEQKSKAVASFLEDLNRTKHATGQ